MTTTPHKRTVSEIVVVVVVFVVVVIVAVVVIANKSNRERSGATWEAKRIKH